MKNIFRKIFFAITLLSCSLMGIKLHAQTIQNTTCEHPTSFCDNDTFVYDLRVAPLPLHCPTGQFNLWYSFHVSSNTGAILVSCLDSMRAFTLWGPIASPSTNACGFSIAQIAKTSTQASTAYSLVDGTQHLSAGFYYLKLTMASCHSTVNFALRGVTLQCPGLPCENCIGSFAPQPGDSFLVSAWVKEDNASTTKTSYNHPGIYIDFPNLSASVGPFRAKGQIIDGWQRIEETFVIPANATSIQIRLQCDTGNCFFDDIRIYPFDGSMKTYVYDPITLRLSAELDERNYATFYEYDEEGKLIRVKKETEKGIMTIQESKTSIIKQ